MPFAVALLLSSSAARAGYTHYWKWRIVPDRAALEATLVEMEKLADAKRSILTDAEGHTGSEAHFRATCPWGEDAGESPCILFNGIGPAQHETFGFPLAPFTNDPAFSFVKTAYKPYDVVAAACLIVARDHFPQDALEISSDGTWADELVAGAHLYERVLGRPAHNPLSPTFAPASGGEQAPVTPPVSRYRWLIFGILVIAFFVVVTVFRPRD